MIRALLFFLCVVTAQGTDQLVVSEECLNYTIYPVQYELTIIPYILDERSYYDGHLSITVIANAPNIRVIELEAMNMQIIDPIKVTDGRDNLVDASRPYDYNLEKGKLYIYLNRPLIPTKSIASSKNYVIQISFRKEVRLNTSGVFLVGYEDDNRQLRYLLQTRLSPDNARYFMPCFDDLRFDSVFKFKVYQLPTNRHVSYSNTSLVISQEQKREKILDGPVIIHYKPSAQVTLREVGFHYSDYSNVKVTSKLTNDTIIVWAPAQEIKNCYFILNFGETLVNMIHEYSTENRSLVHGPINIIAIPKELDGYEIDSWNHLTNNAIKIIYRPEFISIAQVERMKFELALQLSRIWLGSSGEVMKTRWREEWFKEGVAMYLAYYFLAQFDSNGHTIKQKQSLGRYGIHLKHAALLEDSPHSNPALITFNNDLAVNIAKRYKQLVPLKTASLLWMVESWMGVERFHQALVKYIIHKRGLVITLEDFLASLDLNTKECYNEFSKDATASMILNSWFRHPGYPVIEVDVMRAWENDAIVLKQRRFSFTKENRHETSFLIPISYVVQNISNCFNCYKPRFTIGKQTYTFKENLNNGWIILNRNASGYYRVNYDEHTWRLIAQALKDDLNAIDESNRAQIVNDAIALYVAGDMPQHLAMSILDYLDREESQLVWESVADAYEMLRIEKAACSMTRELYNEWQAFLRRKLVNMYNKLTTTIEQNTSTRMFRSRLMELACQVRYQKCSEYMTYLYNRWKKDEKRRIDPDIRNAFYYTTYAEDMPGRRLNAFDAEDFLHADSRRRKEQYFLVKIPKGEPRPENYTMTTSEPFHMSTEKEALTESNKHNGSHALSSYCYLALMAVLMLVLR